MTTQVDGSTAVVCGVAVAALAAWLLVGARHRFAGWRWWQIVAFLSGCAAIAAAVLTPIESLGRDGLLTAHVAQHIILGDAAAPLLLIGLPPQARHWLRARLTGLTDARSVSLRLLSAALSPIGAFAAWTLTAYVWYAPPVHRLAAPAGPIHVLDHVSFLAFGLLIWIGAFDPREPRSLREGLRTGGMPWWARHAYAMGSRVAMVPASAALWVAAGYHSTTRLPLGTSPHADQINAASLLIGFEMLLFSFALVLAFVFLAIAEGHRRATEAPPPPPTTIG